MILVTGATGSIGTHLVRRLRDLRAPFTALVRNADKGRALDCPYVVGDFDDPGSIKAALAGVDRVLLNGAGAVPVPDGSAQPMVAQQKAFIDAAARAGVRRIVKVSVWHAHRGGRLAEGAHWEIEQHLKASGVEWSLLQPSGFMQNFFTGAGSFSSDGRLMASATDAPVSYVDCDDIAACAAVLLAEPAGGTDGGGAYVDGPGGDGAGAGGAGAGGAGGGGTGGGGTDAGWAFAGRTFVVTGPEAITTADVAAQLTAVLGRPVGVVRLGPEAMAARLTAQGVPARFADDVAHLWAEVATGSLATTTEEVRNLTGRRPRTFAQFLAANRAAFH